MNTDPILAALEQSTQASIDQTRVAQALAGEVAGKMGQIDAKVAQKEAEVDSFIRDATPEKRYVQTITLGGSTDYLYPVFWRFPDCSFGVGKLDISRTYNWNRGTLHPSHVAGLLLQIEGNGHGWHGDANYIRLLKYKYSYRQTASHLQFLGYAYRESSDDNPPSYGAEGINYIYSGVYLRGGLTYRLSSNWQFSPVRLPNEDDVNNTLFLHGHQNTRFMVKPIPFADLVEPVEG